MPNTPTPELKATDPRFVCPHGRPSYGQNPADNCLDCFDAQHQRGAY